jgi:hypothetical protein
MSAFTEDEAFGCFFRCDFETDGFLDFSGCVRLAFL